MTTASTLGAILMTPLLTGLLAGTLVPVDAKVRALTPALRATSHTIRPHAPHPRQSLHSLT